jgi:salicylate hydroxylase
MNSQPHVIIVGGGIGGLFAANAQLARGINAKVYEQAPALGEVGAGVYITPNSVRQLDRVGLGPAIEQWGARVGPKSYYFRHDGTPIAPVQVTDAKGWNANFGMHRADLVNILAANLPGRRRQLRPSRDRLRAERAFGARQICKWSGHRGGCGDCR